MAQKHLLLFLPNSYFLKQQINFLKEKKMNLSFGYFVLGMNGIHTMPTHRTQRAKSANDRDDRELGPDPRPEIFAELLTTIDALNYLGT